MYILFSVAFSASRSFIRLSSLTVTPLYLDRRLKYVALLIPCFLAKSPTATPASPFLKIATICDSVNLDFFITFPVTRESPLSTCVRKGEAYGGGRQRGQPFIAKIKFATLRSCARRLSALSLQLGCPTHSSVVLCGLPNISLLRCSRFWHIFYRR
jgi:hypothetical protein